MTDNYRIVKHFLAYINQRLINSIKPTKRKNDGNQGFY